MKFENITDEELERLVQLLHPPQVYKYKRSQIRQDNHRAEILLAKAEIRRRKILKIMSK